MRLSNLLVQNINKKQEYLRFTSVSSYIGVWAKPTLDKNHIRKMGEKQ